MSSQEVLDELGDLRDVVRVLLVADDPGDRGLVQEMLHDAGERSLLTSCDRLDDGQDAISRGLVDLILLVGSGGAGGAHRLDVAPRIPVVALSPVDATQRVTLTEAMRYAVERRRAERRLMRQALNDPLTGLPNRVLFADRLDQALARAARSGSRGRKAPRLVLMFLDLDGFKAVNDGIGHLAGDDLLVEVARRLLEQVRATDTVARLGGDEFTILCEAMQSTDAGVALARRLAESLAEPYAVESGAASVSASIGIAVAYPLQEDAGALLRRADAAMHAAKQAGPGRVALAEAP